MNIYAAIALVNVVTSVVLGLLVLSADYKNTTNRIFAAFAASISFWSYFYFNWQIADDPSSALFFCHMLMAGAIFIAPIYFHFCTNYLENASKHRRLIIAGYIFCAVFSIINWTPLYISSVQPIAGFNYWPVAGVLFGPFLLIWVFFCIYPVYLLVKSLPHKFGEQAAAVNYILAGTIIGYIGGCTNYFLWYGIKIMPYGNISTSFYLGLIAYAMMRHHLMNIKVIATELLIFLIWLFLFARMLLADSYQSQMLDGGLLAVVLVIGVLLIRSVDKEVQQREVIEKQSKDLQIINEQQEGLLHFITHEIKGYLTKSQAGFAAIAEGDFGPTPPALTAMATIALNDVKKGVITVMDILDASNMKKGTYAFKQEPFDFKQSVLDAIKTMQPAADDKGLVLKSSIAWEGAYTFVGDEKSISSHVLCNLIDNAIRYTPSGEIDVELTRIGNTLRFAVKDTGVGVTEEDKRRLFTEGGHGKDSIKVNVHSTGYGLFIAKSIVDAYRGRIWVESGGAGKGSRFIVELPITS